MPVVSVSMPDSLRQRLDAVVEEHGYTGRSEAIREGTRRLLEPLEQESPRGEPMACVVSVVFDWRSNPDGLSRLRHTDSDLVVMNVHSHAADACIELFVLEGSPAAVDSFLARVHSIDGVDAVEHTHLPIADGALLPRQR